MGFCAKNGKGFSEDVKRLAEEAQFIRPGFPKLEFIDLPKKKE